MGIKIGYVVKMYPRLSETFILNEILQMEKCGAEVTIFSIKKPNEGQFHRQVADVKARVYYLEDLDPRKWSQWLSRDWIQLGPNRGNFFGLLDEALSKQDSEGIDLLLMSAWVGITAKKLGIERFHAHFASLPSSVAYLASNIIGIPFSFTAHAKDIFVYDLEEHLLGDKLKAAQFVITVTQYNKRYLLKQAPETHPDRIKVLYNGIDIERFIPDKSIKRQKNQILAVGRLVPKKGFGDLIDACELLKSHGIDFSCSIIGDGPLENELRAKISGYGLQNIIALTGSKTSDEVLQLIAVRNPDVFALRR